MELGNALKTNEEIGKTVDKKKEAVKYESLAVRQLKSKSFLGEVATNLTSGSLWTSVIVMGLTAIALGFGGKKAYNKLRKEKLFKR